MGYGQKLKEVEKNAEHYKALGMTEITLDCDDPDLPWTDVRRIEASGAYRLNGPCGFRCIAERDGFTLRWSVDFEDCEANEKSIHMFDSDRLRTVADKLTLGGRYLLQRFLEDEVLPGVVKVTTEWRGYLKRQLDSEDCLRGIIARIIEHGE